MAQFLRPNGVVTQGVWTGNVSGANIHLDIDEVTRSDTDFAQSQANMTGLCELALTDVFAPDTGTRTVRYALRRTVSNKNLTIVVRLMEGSTTIGGWTHANPPTTLTGYTQTVTASVSNYANLTLQLEVTVNAGGNNKAEVSWFEFEIPNAFAKSSTPAYTNGTGALVRSSTPAFMKGIADDKSAQAAFTKGSLDDKSSQPAYILGAILQTSSVPAFMEAWGQEQLPSSDGITNIWRNEAGGTVLYLSLADESDTTFATIEHAGIDDWFDIHIEDFDEIPDGEMYYEWRAWRISGSQVVSMRAELRQGDDVIATDDRVLSDTPTTFRRTLSISEKASITSTIDLKIRFIVTGVS